MNILNKKKGISIVVPVLNEEGSIGELLKRIDSSVKKTKYLYEVIIIDDHSTDNTKKEIESNTEKYPVKYFKKKGIIGKAQSLLEGFSYAQYDIFCMIDSDLQYPPEAIPEMITQMEDGYGVVIANRKERHTNFTRKFISKSFNFIFGRMLHGLPYDIQSGLKMFRSEIIERVELRPLPWSFDLEFLIAARSAGYHIASVDILFDSRKSGTSKINVIWASLQIGLAALILKFNSEKIIPFHAAKRKRVGQGFHYKRTEFIHFSDLNERESAIKTVFGHQAAIMAGLLILFIVGLLINWETTLTAFVAIITVIYFTDLLFNLFLILKSLVKSPEIEVDIEEINKIKVWPMYTIFCPLYNEWSVVQQFVDAIEKLDYPKDKLQVQLLLEEDDVETIGHVKEHIKLPPYFEIIVVPHTLPKTKPKACNYGLQLAKGEYAVIYDAEDMPDPLQLKKAIVAFAKSPENIACIQAKLNYYNRSQNILTRLFTAEYSLWFDLILTGLQSINAPIPLGGTSNHFKVNRLREVKGWDSFNVTEDCDLGIRLAKRGYRTAIVNSVTLEEANSDPQNWINQRSRWIKGYIQTYLVHMRNPMQFLRGKYKEHFFTFQLVVGGKILSLYINPFMWATTVLYFSLRATIGPTVERFFPGYIFYLAVFCLVFGNFLYMYYYMLGCAKRKQFDLIKFVFLIPIYWLAMSIAAWKGLVQLIVSPHYWPKTKHGLHLKKADPPVAAVRYQNDIAQQVVSQDVMTPENNKKINIIVMSSGLLVLASVVANILNYLYNAYLTRNISIEEFGMISLIGNFLFLTIIPLESLSSSIIYRTAYYLGKYKKPLSEFWSTVRIRGLIWGIAVAALWVLLTPYIAAFFNTTNYLPFYLFAPVWIFNTLLTVDMGFLSGNHRFTAIAVIALLTPFYKMLLTIVFVSSGHEDLVYAAIPISIVLSSMLAYFFVKMLPKSITSKTENKALLNFPTRYFFMTALTRFSLVSYLSLDIMLAKHYLSAGEAGLYALIALMGKMIFFIGGLFNQFIVPFVSREGGEEGGKKASFKIIFVAATVSSWLGYIIFGIFGELTAPLLLGDNIRSVAYLLPLYGLGVFCFSIASSIISYHIVRKSYILAVSSFLLALAQLIAIYFFHDSVEHIVETMAIVGIVNLVITIALHFFNDAVHSVFQNILDFASLLVPIPNKKLVNKDSLRILIYNWRDTKHVWAGGAEAYIHGIAKELVKQDHQVTIFCGNDKLSKRFEEIDGVQIIRRGGFFTVYIWAFIYYVIRFRGKFDVIIDSVNGVPFFTPLYTNIPIITVIHHVHQEVFRENLPGPLAAFACFLEAKMMPLVYRKEKIVTVSESTRNNMKYIGFKNKDLIEIVNPGIETDHLKPGKKTKVPTILYLGRLKKYKSIDVAIDAMTQIIKEIPDAQLSIAGFGEWQSELELLVDKLGLYDHVHFLGKISETQKSELLSESWVFVHPSFMEGWGITAIEASASGTPVVASDVPGLRDSVQDGKNGYLAQYGNSDEFAVKIVQILKDKKLRSELGTNAVDWSKNFSWKKSAERMMEILHKQI